MTELPRGRAHWGTSLVIAPAAAALFGASVWWAADAVPSSAETTAATPLTASTAPALVHITPPAVVDVAARHKLAHALAAHRHDSIRLHRRLAALREELHRLRTAADPASVSGDQGGGYSGVAGPSVGTVGSSGSGGTGGSGSGMPPGVAAPAPAPAVVAPAPVVAPPAPVVQAPAPPVQANTGASGSP